MCRCEVCAVVLLLAAVAPVGGVWAAPFSFGVTGDSRGDDSGINEMIVTELVAAFIAEDVDLVIHTGDAITDGTEAELIYWRDTFMAPLRAAGIGVYLCRGGHDPIPAVWNSVFSGMYAMPMNGPAGEEGITYSFEYENAVFVAFEQLVLDHLMQAPQAWLDAQLALNAQPHVFVYTHAPAFCTHHDDAMGSFPEARDVFWDSLGQGGCHVSFYGHDHFYNHARAADSNGDWIHQYIVGTGGAPIYHWDGVYRDPDVEGIAHVEEYGYVVVDVDGYEVQLTFKERVAAGSYVAGDTYAYTTPLALPRAEFSVEAGTLSVSEEVAFVDESLPGLSPITTWLWDFGDGGVSGDANPTHVYDEAGTYAVSLTVTNAYGSHTRSLPSLVVLGVPVAGGFGLAAAVGLVLIAGVFAVRGCRL